MTLTGKKTSYFIARKNASNNEDSILRFNSYNGLFSAVNDFGQATKYETFQEVNNLVKAHNMLSSLTGQAYEYYAMRQDEESFRLDEEGNAVTENEEVPVDEPTE